MDVKQNTLYLTTQGADLLRDHLTLKIEIEREGGTVEFTPTGGKAVISAYQTRKQETLQHPILEQEYRIGQFMLIQARILARHLRR